MNEWLGRSLGIGHSVSIHGIIHRNRDLPLFLPLFLYRDLKRGTQNGFPERAWAMQEEQHSFSHSCFLLPPQTSHEMMMQCVSRVVSHPLHVISMRCMVQFVGREVKYRVIQEVALGLSCTSHPSFCPCSGLVPHILGDVIFLWCCNLLAHFINTYAVDDNVSERPLVFLSFQIAVSMLTYPFLLVGDLMAVNNCGLRAGLPPYAPVFASWIHCWRYLSAQVREQGTHWALGSLCSFPKSPNSRVPKRQVQPSSGQ
uniref:Mitochondrial carrier 1 n=1 Tax=Zosterops lateralis melanops TaxID=1220523 RepID=A0A8D2P0X6_ZOSLA